MYFRKDYINTSASLFLTFRKAVIPNQFYAFSKSLNGQLQHSYYTGEEFF